MVIQSPQEMEVVVNGPNGANRLFVFTGLVAVGYLGSNELNKKTIAFNVGPTLNREQFHRAVATASLAEIKVNNPASGNGVLEWKINSVDADWDDEKRLVEVRIEAWTRNPSPSSSVTLMRVGYQVNVLAQL